MKRLAAAMLALLLLMGLMIGCSKEEDTPTPDADQRARNLSALKPYAYIGMGETSPYSIKVAEGFKNACTELGVEAIIKQPGVTSSEEQKALFDSILEEDLGGIVVSGLDQAALNSAAEAAKAKSIPLIAADLYLKSGDIYVNGIDAGKAGALLADAAGVVAGGEGKIALISAPQAEQNGWTSAFEAALAGEAYNKLELVKVIDCMDDANRTEVEVSMLIKEYPNLRCIVALTPTGLAAAAKVAKQNSFSVKVTGFGLPSELSEYIQDGTCPFMYMWNPTEVGYAAGFAAYALAGGRISGAQGDVLPSNRLGELKLKSTPEAETALILDAVFKFEAANVDEWKDVF